MSKITGEQLAKAFESFAAEKWGYVFGLNGAMYTAEMAENMKARRASVPKGKSPETYFTQECKKWVGHMAADCSGGIVCAIRQYEPSFKDRNADTFKSQFEKSFKIAEMPEIRGLALHKSGHIGVYIGGGKVAEFMSTAKGCVINSVSGRGFTSAGTIAGVEYGDGPLVPTVGYEGHADPPGPEGVQGEPGVIIGRNLKLGMSGNDVWIVKNLIFVLGFYDKKITHIAHDKYGVDTVAAVTVFQQKNGLKADGIVGKQTITALGGKWVE
jgi:hypothetical protein